MISMANNCFGEIGPDLAVNDDLFSRFIQHKTNHEIYKTVFISRFKYFIAWYVWHYFHCISHCGVLTRWIKMRALSLRVNIEEIMSLFVLLKLIDIYMLVIQNDTRGAVSTIRFIYPILHSLTQPLLVPKKKMKMKIKKRR